MAALGNVTRHRQQDSSLSKSASVFDTFVPGMFIGVCEVHLLFYVAFLSVHTT